MKLGPKRLCRSASPETGRSTGAIPGNSPAVFEIALPGMQVARRIQQKVDQRGMQAGSGHQHGLGPDQHDILFRNVNAKSTVPAGSVSLVM